MGGNPNDDKPPVFLSQDIQGSASSDLSAALDAPAPAPASVCSEAGEVNGCLCMMACASGCPFFACPDTAHVVDEARTRAQESSLRGV